MKNVLILPVLIPLAAAAIGLLLPSRAGPRRALALAATAALTAVAAGLLHTVWREGVQVLRVGGWEAPVGITLAADLLSAMMVLLSGTMGLLCVVYSAGSLEERQEAGAHYPLVLVMLAGVCGSFLTADLFNLFVWFELMLVASFVLLALEAERERLEACLKYMTLSLLGSALFLIALALLYAVGGSLNLADLAMRLPGTKQPPLATAAAMLLLAVFGLKAAAFPFSFWLPASYHTPPVVVTALFSALLTKVGVYALFRTFPLLFSGDPGLTQPVILGMAVLSMLVGVTGAVVQYDLRRLLSFEIISQVGYLLAGLGLSTRAALAAAIAYWVHYVCAKSALFFVTGALERVTGTHHLGKMGGLSRTHPLLGLLFLVPALSLAGMPPFSGFFAKMALLRAALRAEMWGVAGVGAAVGLLTLYILIKVWREVFWKTPPQEAQGPSGPAAMLGPCVVLALLMVGLGLGARPLFVLSDAAAGQLLDRDTYIHAVLGGDT
ncbi:proton-conducting transporter membrane subunit [Stigmatella aurantiaca]|uniref:NADH-ubiquinone/plastoquinone oxidoreductase family protein n=2 Tax=Stigmatella aurantiaca (strain DW4/3-1) TaxID=378806 RepID=E3FDI2_STIAD|nr:proton-conducting transporter membrane subunit [Stigmatella aurantiaca]ADO68861.1 NADH-ubiquinone/plastoquinone oxidoreductase family protein [Stigmatella aurantiaca DW4/3-1]